MSGGLQIERLQEQMRRLRLGRSVDQLPAMLEHAAKRELSYSDFLEELLASEISEKQERNTSMRVAMAHFPFVSWGHIWKINLTAQLGSEPIGVRLRDSLVAPVSVSDCFAPKGDSSIR